MNNLIKNVMSVPIEDELKKSYLDYAMSVIIGRALPDVRDGLKPVHRRILYAMIILKNHYNKPYKKSARIVGDVIGKYHPHGDTAVYDAIVRMAQNFSLRYTLIDGQGNFGSLDGDSAAAMRYTEIRMSHIANEMLLDLEKNTVDYHPNYDNSEQIPCILPTRIPNLLINGSSGIAVGMATNIPPHNINEIINGCIAYLDDENISLKSLMSYIKGPDFPTGGIIDGIKGIKSAYKNGYGKIKIRALSEIKRNKKTNRDIIIIKEIPYQVNKSSLVEKIAILSKEKKIAGIYNIRDESDQEGVRIVIEIKKDFSAEVVLNNLYSMTNLQSSFGINMVALVNNKPKVLSLKDMISKFIQHRKEVITRRSIFEIKKIKKNLSSLEALLVTTINTEKIIKIIKSSSNKNQAIYLLSNCSWCVNYLFNKFIKKDYFLDLKKKNEDRYFNIKNNKYFLSKYQSKKILGLKLEKFTKLEKNNFIKKYKHLLKEYSELKLILNNNRKMLKIIKNELIKIKNIHSDNRKTKILMNSYNLDKEDLITQENVVVTLSHKGYVKYQPLIEYEAQHRGGKGKLAASIKEKDFINHLLIANTHDNILLFSNFGKMFRMKVYQLPEASRESRGKPIVNLIPLHKNEVITALLRVKEYKEKLYVFMATEKGFVKKTSLNKFGKPRSNGVIAIKLNKNDKLIGVDLTNGNDEIMLFSTYGKVVRFSEKSVRNMGRSAYGVRGIILSNINDHIVSLIVPKGKGSILTVTHNGYGKRTNKSEFPVRSRYTKGVISIKTSNRNGNVVGSIQVNSFDQIMMITDSGNLVRIKVCEINVISRNTKGVTLIKTKKNEKVVGLQKIAE
ncbi:MAG: DNA gyrase subunit A [Enterobacteriaceae bacterium]